MENDADVRELLKLIFGKKPTIPEEMVAHSPIPTYVLNKDFSKKMKDVLLMRKYIVYNNWKNFFEDRCRDMLSSHLNYLRWVMYACLFEHKYNRNIFDSFISVVALVMNISNETLTKVGIDLSDLNSDIILVFYRDILKSSFPEHGGFYGFVEYICRHKYLKWNWEENDLNLFDNDTAFKNFKPDLVENIAKEYNSYPDLKGLSGGIISAMDATAACMAENVLSTTSSKLPTLLSEHDLIKRLVASRKKQQENKANRNRRDGATSTFQTSHGDLSSNSDSKTNCFTQQQKNTVQHENIIQAVIRHNHSNTSRHENVKNKKQVEVEGTLEHLKNSMKPLIEFLENVTKNNYSEKLCSDLH